MSKNSRNRNRRERMKAALVNDGRVESCGDRTLVAVEQYLESKGLCFFKDPEKGLIYLDLTFYPPESVTYRNKNGEAACLVTFVADDEGFVTVASPAAWNLVGFSHRAAVSESLVRMTPDLPLVRFQHDLESDGITPFVIVPIGDWGVSGDSILEGIARFINGILVWDPVIRRAMETGEVSVPDISSSREGLSPDEVIRISRGLVARLNKHDKTRWRRVRQELVANAGETGVVALFEELNRDYLFGVAAIVHGGRFLALKPTLPVKFKKVANLINQFVTDVMSDLPKPLGL